ncbi:MAG: NAD(P)/FAD-dependent oxidoreductase [Pseudomonadota bacterium]
MTTRPTAEIAGGGFAGLTLATALAQRGWKVRVHERAPEIRAFGAGIWIYENGIHVLNSIGAADEAFEGRSAAKEFINWDPQKRIVHHSRYADIASPAGGRVFVVTRQRLLMAIYHAALREGVEVVVGSKVVAVEANGALITEGGQKYSADLVVGADGVNSKVRDALGLLKSSRNNPDGAIRLLLPHLPDYADSWNDDILRGWWTGRRRASYHSCGDGVMYLCFTAPINDAAGSRVPMDKATWTASFPALASIINRIGDDVRYDAFVTTKLKRWSAGRVAIIGDAAHSMVPGLGQGCGISLVNALSLANVLAQTRDIQQSLAKWEAACRPLTEHTQFWSSFAWPKSRWPAPAVRLFFHFPGWASWVGAQKAITMNSLPLGVDPRQRWYPPVGSVP